MTRQAKIGILFAVGIVLLLLVGWGVVSLLTNKTSETVIQDKDTGETIDTADEGEQTGGDIAKKSDIVLFGTKNLAEKAREKNEKTGRYLLALQDALWSFSEKRLENKYPTLTIRPDSLVITQSKITGEIRVGQSNTILPFEVAISPGFNSAIVVINEDGKDFGGTFVFVGGLDNSDEYLFEITQKNDTSTDLIIESYGGYWDAALSYLTSIGYNVPDFSIELKNHEDIF